MHDSQLISYCVDFETKTLSMRAYLVKKDQQIELVMKDVLTHHFENILNENILLDIEETHIDCFMDENIELLKNAKDDCWPMVYDDIDGLKKYLLQNRYKYIKIYSSFGLCGWVLAKGYNLRRHS